MSKVYKLIQVSDDCGPGNLCDGCVAIGDPFLCQELPPCITGDTDKTHGIFVEDTDERA